MKLNRIFASLVILAATASASFADGVVSISWNSCVGPNAASTPGGAPLNAFVSVLGQTQTAQSYQCVTVGQQPGGVRDAWRFDPNGCEGSSFFTLNHLAPASVVKTCPSFQGTLASLQIKDYSYDAVSGKVKIVLANAYPNGGAGNPAATNASVRYFLANYVFDLTFATPGPSDANAGTCGGVEVPACFGLVSASWLDTAGNEISWTHGNDFLTVNDPNHVQSCPATVPAQSTTWGKVKGQYR